MFILDRKYTIKELQEINSFANGFVKGVVDLDKELVALDADMHYELADYLIEKQGSKEIASWLYAWRNGDLGHGYYGESDGGNL